MLGFIQYGSRLFGIDASSDSAKFQDDLLSESGLRGVKKCRPFGQHLET